MDTITLIELRRMRASEPPCPVDDFASRFNRASLDHLQAQLAREPETIEDIRAQVEAWYCGDYLITADGEAWAAMYETGLGWQRLWPPTAQEGT